jgi:hypothetical protein
MPVQSIIVKSYSDNLYQAAENGSYDHYIFFEANHISTVVADAKNKQLMQMNVFTAKDVNFLNLSYDELKQIEPLKEELQLKFKERKVIVSSPNCTLVPESLLNVVETEAYYVLNQKLLPNSQVSYCKMHVQQTACIYNLRNELLKMVRFNMPMVDVYHSSLLFIKAVESQAFENGNTKLHLHVHPGFIELLNFDGQIRFYNNFLFETETEIVYYLLATAEQLQISHGCDVVLYGNSGHMTDLHALLSKYVRSVQYGIKPKAFAYPLSFKQFGEHQFFTESSALLCE